MKRKAEKINSTQERCSRVRYSTRIQVQLPLWLTVETTNGYCERPQQQAVLRAPTPATRATAIRKDCFQVKSNLLTDFLYTTHMNIMILN